MDAAKLIIGHGVWIGLSMHWDAMGFLVGGIIALMTAPEGILCKMNNK